jgi:HTH-type transcriptional regulator/antitoxin HigA
MDIRPIHTEDDLTWALNEIAVYFEHQPISGSPDADRFEVLATLIDTYESEHWAIPEADPIDVLNYAISDMGRSQADLAEILGSRSRASEVLSRRRPLTLDMIRKISSAWKLPVELLVAPYNLAPDKSRDSRKAKAPKRSRKTKAA